jgi:hypothetical protein
MLPEMSAIRTPGDSLRRGGNAQAAACRERVTLNPTLTAAKR